MPTYADDYKNTFTNYSGSSEMYKKEPFDLEDMQAHLTEFPEIQYVSFPQTWFGYGTEFVSLANNEYLEKYFSNHMFSFGTQLFVLRDVFFSDDEVKAEIAELFFYVQNDSPVISDEIHSRLEHEARIEFLNDEIRYEMELEPEEIEDLFQKLEIDYSDWVDIDNDGYTVYALKGDLQELFALLKAAL